MGRDRALKMFADVDRQDCRRRGAAAAAARPQRPGAQRRHHDVGPLATTKYGMVHDEVSTDRRNPRLNANGPIYAVDWTNDWFIWDLRRTTRRAREGASTRTATTKLRPDRVRSVSLLRRSARCGRTRRPHNPMMDARAVSGSRRRSAADEPAWCKEGSKNKFAQYYPLDARGRQASALRPEDQQFTLIDTCFGTHHLQFDKDADQTLYFNDLLGPMVGWINTRSTTGRTTSKAAQGWCPQIVDTNGDGKITKPWNQPARGRAVTGDEHESARLGLDPKRDTEVNVQALRDHPEPGRQLGLGCADEVYPGLHLPVDRGANPPETCVTEVYKVPGARLPAARHRHRSQRRRLDGARGEQPSRELRPAQVQGVERAESPTAAVR